MPIKCTCVRCAALAVPAGYEGIEISAAVVSVFSHQLMGVQRWSGYVCEGGWVAGGGDQ